jgi:uncharacterized NAD(P)/FAD-binding protein YdhS
MTNFKTPEIEEISDILKSIYRICAEKGIEFEHTMDGEENEVAYNKKTKKISFNLPNLEEENLIKNLKHWENEIKATL